MSIRAFTALPPISAPHGSSLSCVSEENTWAFLFLGSHLWVIPVIGASSNKLPSIFSCGGVLRFLHLGGPDWTSPSLLRLFLRAQLLFRCPGLLQNQHLLARQFTSKWPTWPHIQHFTLLLSNWAALYLSSSPDHMSKVLLPFVLTGPPSLLIPGWPAGFSLVLSLGVGLLYQHRCGTLSQPTPLG